MAYFLITGLGGAGKAALVRVMTKRGVRALDTDAIDGLTIWRNIQTGEDMADRPPLPIDFQVHRFAWRHDAMKNLFRQRGTVFIFGGAWNARSYFPCFEHIFVLAQDKPLPRPKPNRKRPSKAAVPAAEPPSGFQGATIIPADRPLGEIADEIIATAQAVQKPRTPSNWLKLMRPKLSRLGLRLRP